jgi:galactonate dehydratase
VKITALETLLVDVGGRNLCFVQVCTDAGLKGLGEAYSAGPDRATAEVIAYFGDWLVGLDPLDIEGLWQRLYIGSRFPGGVVVNAALSGIDIALWDLKGKALDAPVYQMLGGKCRTRIRVYQSVDGADTDAVVEAAERLVETRGLTAIKANPLPADMEQMGWTAVLHQVDRRMALLRHRLGDDVEIALDPHAQLLEPSKAVELCQVLEPYHPLFVEEPLRPENRQALADVRAKARVPIATGEMLYTKWEFRDLLRQRAVDVVQPDVCCCGGITEMKKIAALAEAEYVTVAPHNPLGPVSTAASVHLAATLPTFLILEYVPDDAPPRRDLVHEPYRLVDGYLEIPERPGLGIALNEDWCRQHPYRAWRRGQPLKPDGAVAFI